MDDHRKRGFMNKAQAFFYAGLLVSVLGFVTMPSILPFGWLLFLITGYFYGQAKGYSSIVGGALGFFGALGLGILLFMPDRNVSPPTGEPLDKDRP